MRKRRSFDMKLFDITDTALVITTADNNRFDFKIQPAMYLLLVEKCRAWNEAHVSPDAIEAI